MNKQLARTRDGIGVAAAAIGGAGIGAGLMFLLDPRQGRRRRALLRDQAVRAWHDTEQLVQAGVRDAAHRAQGLVAEAKAVFSEGGVDDDVVAERIKSKLGRTVTHPNALEIRVEQGCAILSGPILSREVDHLIACVKEVRGVKKIENRLEVHENADDIPALQGEGRLGYQGLVPLRAWHPSTKLLVFGTASMMVAYGMLRSGWLAMVALGALGCALGARARGEQPHPPQSTRRTRQQQPRPQA